jgi:hypothetical protein
MDQLSLFAPEPATTPEKPTDLPVRMRVLMTVKAAPNPSARYGETVCVAGLRVDPDSPGWVRMYPINFRELDSDSSFRKYDVVTVTARPAHDDPRAESWRPDMSTLVREDFLPPWRRRQAFVADHIEDSMCALLRAVRRDPPGRSLAAIRPRQVIGLEIEAHPGWTPDEQAKIDLYVNQLELPGFSRGPRTPLEAPRFRGWYRYRCAEPGCGEHRQGIIDWEWVAFQRRLPGTADQGLRDALRRKFLDEICAVRNDVVFFVGNQAKRQHVFMVLGVFYPPRSGTR